MEKLLEIMARLRDPKNGCPWDKEQNYASIVPHTLEEVYEVAETIETEHLSELKNELGDLLFQIVFYSQLAKEEQRFDFNDVVEAISDKLIRRHPHVFSDAKFNNADEQSENWEEAKEQERQQHADKSALADIPAAFPALTRSQKLQSRAARVGFDWPDVQGVFDKVDEEVLEVKEAWDDEIHREEELGDLLFSCVNLVRHAGLNAESVLRKANRKFERRFRLLEVDIEEQGGSVSTSSIDELEATWRRIKKY